jgi:hypothetical protein
VVLSLPSKQLTRVRIPLLAFENENCPWAIFVFKSNKGEKRRFDRDFLNEQSEFVENLDPFSMKSP